MDFRFRDSLFAAALIVLAACAGCANLETRKVPLRDRVDGFDCQQGFRYYLNRPYLIVKEPILLYEHKSLVLGDPRSKKCEHLDGPNAGETFEFSERPVHEPSENFRVARVDELERLKKLVGEDARDDAIEQASAELEIGPDSARLGTGAAGAASELGSGEQATFASLSEGARAETSMIELKDPSVSEDTTLSGKMEIVYLPDLDEQYVIKSKNCMAKSAFSLSFKNGSELVEVQGEHDSTTLAIALLSQIQNAIGVAQGVEQARIERQSKGTGGATQSGTKQVLARGEVPTAVFQVIERVSIKPGVYRLNKPWEIVDGEQKDLAIGMGLLAQLGLPTTSDVSFAQVTSLVKQDPGVGE